MLDRSTLLTEQRLADSMNLDRLSVEEALALFNHQDAAAAAAVAKVADAVAAAVRLITGRLRGGGRLFYFGAGTSGRLGVLDASECPPTFGTDPELVQAIIAGGPPAVFRSQEGAEDRTDEAARAVAERNIGPADAVVGIAAGGTTPFVHAALNTARQRGAATVFFCCVQPTPGEPAVDVVIRPLTGPEVLTGSTRLKAGTATKLVLNQISTLTMVQLGKCYENLMVDLRATNAKLRDRAIRIVCTVAAVDRTAAQRFLDAAGGQAKLACLMARRNLDAGAAQALLNSHGGSLRAALTSDL